MKKIVILLLFISQIGFSQVGRQMLQDYNTIALLRAETINPKANDKVFVRDSQFIFYWDKNSTLTDDGYFVVKQTNQATGRYRLVLSYTKASIDSTTVINGLTEVNNQVALGGALTMPTALTTSTLNTLAITGLQSGSNTDSLLVVDPITGVLKRVSYSLNNSNDWKLTGNIGTNPSTNFLGTSDAQDLVFRTNNLERLRITSDTNGSRFITSNTTSSNGSLHFGNTASNGTTSANNNTSFGIGIMPNVTTGDFNSSFGKNSMNAITIGRFNCSFGVSAGQLNVSGNGNTYLGYAAGQSNLSSTNNTAVGHAALQLSSSSNNTAVGNNSSQANTTGGSNTSVGDRSLAANKTSSDNAIFGFIAANGSLNGFNTILGSRAVSNSNPQYSSNIVSVGFNSLINLRGGNFNIAIGSNTGQLSLPNPNSNGLDSAIRCIYIGSNAIAGSDTVEEEVIISANNSTNSFAGGGSFTTTIGSLNNTHTMIPKGMFGLNLGAGSSLPTIKPTSTLQVNGNIAIKDTNVITANYTMSALNDAGVIQFKTGASGTINLTAGAIRSRIYELINYSGVNLTLNMAIKTSQLTTTTILPNGEKMTIYFDGAEWVRKN